MTKRKIEQRGAEMSPTWHWGNQMGFSCGAGALSARGRAIKNYQH
jgi:hypothetical protein